VHLRLATVFRYLVGRKSAIQEIAANQHSLLIGFLFCLSAALARHYDGKYLVREPWFLLAPAGASILTSSIVFLFVYIATSINARRRLPGIVRSYLSFLGLYWMTAPLAWLYGIPYERFLNEVDAAQANVWTLELVSLWRVLLISRVVSVLTPCSFFSGITKVAVPAFSLLYVALIYARTPLVDWMGGVRVPPSVQPVASAYLGVMFYGVFAIFFGGILWLISLTVRSPGATLEGFRRAQRGEVGKALPILASVVVLIFTVALPFTQREQRLRYQVETDLKNNRIDDALTTLATHARNEFPPQWTPPPWPEYGDGDRNPNLVQIVEALKKRNDIPEWVQSAYREKAELYLSNKPEAETAAEMTRNSKLRTYSGNGSSPCEESKRDLLLARRPAFWVVFRSSSCSDFVVETSIGAGECGSNPTTEAQSWKGAVGTGQNARPPSQDIICYRTRPINNGQWSQWRILSRYLAEHATTESYDVSVP
jgi:hypothetical protein